VCTVVIGVVNPHCKSDLLAKDTDFQLFAMNKSRTKIEHMKYLNRLGLLSVTC